MAKTYAKTLTLMSDMAETKFIKEFKYTCFSSLYPFKIFPDRGLREIFFEPITIFCGGNGSGKSTLLNILGEKTGLRRRTAMGRSTLFDQYVDACSYEGVRTPTGSDFITSDDVFAYLSDVRRTTEAIDVRRTELFEELNERRKPEVNPFTSLADYDEWLENYEARKKSMTKSKFVRQRLRTEVELHSNGESAMNYFAERIGEEALYLLDEPENSLSVPLQMKLRDFLADSVRYFGCQFVIATHSPILLSLEGARIYDLDADPVEVRPWTEIDNVRRYFEFFEDHRDEFQ